MYESFFKLRAKPFDLLPDPRYIYLSRSHKKALTYLDYGIQERSGFILLTGEVGSGKTTLIRDLLEKHYEHAVLSKIFNTCVSSEQLLAMINDDFGLEVQGKDKVTLIRDLNGFLVEQYAKGVQPILIIDEAQNLDTELLEEVRMLSNLETSDSKLLQIILVGQPELRSTLSAPSLRQLRQRISINCHLQELGREEIEQYIVHRLEVAGNAAAVDFSAGALEAVHRYSRGIPRLINIICDFLMLSAFAEETKIISVEMVRDVIGDLDFENHYWSSGGMDSGAGNVPESDSSFSAVNNQALFQELYSLLKDISKRLDVLEQHNTNPAASAIGELQNGFEALRKMWKSREAKTDARIMDLKKDIDSLRSQRVAAPPPEENTGAGGLVRRFLGGGGFSRRSD